jgi:hypothetical protein
MGTRVHSVFEFQLCVTSLYFCERRTWRTVDYFLSSDIAFAICFHQVILCGILGASYDCRATIGKHKFISNPVLTVVVMPFLYPYALI